MTERAEFPLVWDNSMRSCFVECPWKFEKEYLRHYRPLRQSVHLHAGKAFAAALETARLAFYRDKLPQEDCEALGLEMLIKEYGDYECDPGSNKALHRMIEALAYYFRTFPFEYDDVQPYMGKNGPMVEFSFALPLSEKLRHPVTDEPLIYSGRADMVATFAGALSIYDDKTTSSLGASWAAQWDRRSQFSGYAWAARAMNIPISQIVIRGIAILKTKIEAAQAISVRTPHHVAEWHAQAVRDISRAKAMWEEGFWDKNLADACSSFGGCMFKQACGAEDPAPYLFSNFAQRKWNPLTREEETIGEGNGNS